MTRFKAGRLPDAERFAGWTHDAEEKRMAAKRKTTTRTKRTTGGKARTNRTSGKTARAKGGATRRVTAKAAIPKRIPRASNHRGWARLITAYEAKNPGWLRSVMQHLKFSTGETPRAAQVMPRSNGSAEHVATH